MTITQSQSEAALSAAISEARALGVPMNVAVFDGGANLKAFVRMDGALLGSIDIALGKAKTAALFGMNTETVGEFCRPDGPSPGLENTNGGLVVFAGGVPLRAGDGQVIGALGVSGGHPDQDAQVAAFAARTVQQMEEDSCSCVSPERPPSSQQR